MKHIFRALLMALVILVSGQSRAGIPVIDAANLLNSAQQVQAWGQQYVQMAQQYRQLVDQLRQAQQTYNSLNGVRGMADLVNNPAVRRYMPNEWSQVMSVLTAPGGYTALRGSAVAIRDAAQIMRIEDTTLSPTSDAGRAFIGSQNQFALNRALSEDAYKAASERIASIQTLIDQVNGVPDQKDVLDLQARIQGEQVMVQNELAKLTSVSQLQVAQDSIRAQQAREIVMKSVSSPGGVPRF